MTSPPSLFDRRALIMRRDRAAASGFRDADFLHARAAAEIADRLGDVPRAFPSALIVGSGGGAYARALRGHVGAEALEQVEPSPRLAALAREVAPTTVGDGPEAAQGGPFDLVVLGLGLHAENDPVGLLTRIRLALKPDGLLLGATLGGRTLAELRAALAEAEAAEEGGLSPRVAPMIDIRDAGALLQRAGFAMPVADLDGVDVDYPDALALMRDLRAMGEANALAERRRCFTRRATLLRACALYAEHFPAGPGRVRARFDIVHLSGWAPAPGQPVPKRPGSATARLADALGTVERPAGEKPGG
ncbi:MAG: methyltransferase domain-containing protein [Rubrimonas sp.]|uniref:methyltransferase domain-containing protein n=1 Tax=Rubrimonas sp. TaxID=2036015 RepID=UPI002FDE7798